MSFTSRSVKRRPGRPEAGAQRPSEWALFRSVVYYRACAQLERHPTLWRSVVLGLGLLLALGVTSHQRPVCHTATIEPHDCASTPACRAHPWATHRCSESCFSTPTKCTRSACRRSAQCVRSACTVPIPSALTGGVTRRKTCAARVPQHPTHAARPPRRATPPAPPTPHAPPTPRRPTRAAGPAPHGWLARGRARQARRGVAPVRCRGAGDRGGSGDASTDAAAGGRCGQADLLAPHLLGHRGTAGRG